MKLQKKIKKNKIICRKTIANKNANEVAEKKNKKKCRRTIANENADENAENDFAKGQSQIKMQKN